jgi:hypothetical protein
MRPSVLFYWQIMHIQVTVETPREHRHLLFRMWLRMTSETLWKLPMPRMAGSTTDLPMLACCLHPFTVNTGMAVAAQFGSGFRRESNSQRLMRRMTGEAFRQCLFGYMRLMASKAGRYETVLLLMAVRALLLCMLARMLLDLPDLIAMAIATNVLHQHQVDRLGGGMRRMAILAIHLFFTMRFRMTLPALRHQLGIIPFHRIVGVKDQMTFLAGKLVFTAVLPQITVMSDVTLTALHGSQRRRFARI